MVRTKTVINDGDEKEGRKGLEICFIPRMDKLWRLRSVRCVGEGDVRMTPMC